MVHALLQVLGVQGGEHIEEVGSWWSFIFGVLVREERLELGILLEHRVDVPDRQLVVMRDLDEGHIRLPQQLLLAREDILEEVLVDNTFIRQIILHYIWEKISASYS